MTEEARAVDDVTVLETVEAKALVTLEAVCLVFAKALVTVEAIIGNAFKGNCCFSRCGWTREKHQKWERYLIGRSEGFSNNLTRCFAYGFSVLVG